ncbi:kinase-like protein [Trametes sanguinea]|nr:kinase-like protein [Trametes sanguinea]
MSAPASSTGTEPPAKRIIKFRELAPLEDGGLFSHEKFWRDHQQWLQDQGYMLRRRYHPDWIPSWQGTKRDPYDCEDGLRYKRLQIMDAVRVSDSTVVMLKMVKRSLHPYEVEIAQMFSIEPLASDPHNHCVPVYEVLESPMDSDAVFLVMPFLRTYNDPRFDTVGEAVACIKQLLEGIHFLHQQRVAHRDIMNLNFMMDPAPIISETWHPHIPHRSYDTRRKVYVSTRTRHPIKYYIIDFGISRRYPADCVSPLEDPIWGGIKTVPEFQGSDEPRDPFPTDIYYVGYLLWEDFVERSKNFEFLRPLVDDMMQEDPAKRPTIAEAVERFNRLSDSLSMWKLRSRVIHKKDSSVAGFFRSLRHVYRTAEYILTRKPATPSLT